MSTDEDTNSDKIQKFFGASVRKQPIRFVPAGYQASGQVVPRASESVADQYLSIVLKDEKQETAEVEQLHSSEEQKNPANGKASEQQRLCEICKQPLEADQEKEQLSFESSHELSLAHQVCVDHSYPPSHLDRRRQGLKYLAAYGWDVDSRRGLGASGEGRRAPVRANVKNDSIGLGMKIPDVSQKAPKAELLDAGKVRKKDKQDKKRNARLEEIFYRDEDVEKYLGGST